MLPQPQLNHVKGSCSQPRCWLSHPSPPLRPLGRGHAPLPAGCHCPSLTCQSKGMGLHTLPDLQLRFKLTASAGRVLRSLGCILTETYWVAPTYAVTSCIAGSDATAGEGSRVTNCCGSCLVNQLGGTQPGVPGGSSPGHGESRVGLPGGARSMRWGRKDVCLHRSARR